MFLQAERGLFHLAVSVVTARELQEAPVEVQEFFARTFRSPDQIHELTAAAGTLAQAYVAASIVTAKYVDDLRHVAIATVHGLGVIVSWNIQHLANLRRELGFNAVNRLQNYPQVRILSPLELIYEDDQGL